MVRKINNHVKISKESDLRDYHNRRVKYVNGMCALWQILVNSKNPRSTEKEINRRAEEWDRNNSKGHNYHDLHFMTKFGAIDYVRRIVQKCQKNVVLRLETGRGNNSIDNVPVIKNALMALYTGSIRQDPNNPGVLRLIVG